MIGLGAGFYGRLFDLDEIADVHAFAEPRAWPQPRKRSDDHAFADMSAGEMRERADRGTVLDLHLLAELHIGLDHDVLAERGVGGEKRSLGRDQGDAGIE